MVVLGVPGGLQGNTGVLQSEQGEAPRGGPVSTEAVGRDAATPRSTGDTRAGGGDGLSARTWAFLLRSGENKSLFFSC